MPSNRPPIRSIAARLLALRASVFSVTRSDRQPSKAWRSSSSLQAVFTCVRCAHGAYHVEPISATVGGCSSEGSGPGAMPGGHGAGQTKTSRSRKRVAPAISPEPRSRTANGTWRPESRAARPCSAKKRASASPSGTQVYP